MSWPSSQDFNEAVQSPRVNFNDADLRWGAAVSSPQGIPIPRSGNVADVYELRCPGGGRWAVKCFTREVAGLSERYDAISRCLAHVKLPFFVDFIFLQRGIRVGSEWFPILKMQWVEGLTLNAFARQYADKPPMLNNLLQIWLRMAARLRQAGIAHADLQHGNVLLASGFAPNALALQLVDYDGMFVPALTGSDSGETGHPCYQHPKRFAEGTYNREVDRFPLLLIAAALTCLKVGGKALWDKYDCGDNLLFREDDLRSPANSPLFGELLKLADPQAMRLVREMLTALNGRLESTPLLEEVLPELLGPVAPKSTVPITAPGLTEWLQEPQAPNERKPTQQLMPIGTSIIEAAAVQIAAEAQRQVPDAEAKLDPIEDYVEDEKARSRSRRIGILLALSFVASAGLAVLVLAVVSTAPDTGKKKPPPVVPQKPHNPERPVVPNEEPKKEQNDKKTPRDDIPAPPQESLRPPHDRYGPRGRTDTRFRRPAFDAYGMTRLW